MPIGEGARDVMGVQPKNAAQLAGERDRRRFDKTAMRLEAARAAKNEAPAEEEQATEANAEKPESTYDQWRKYLLAKGDLTPEGNITVPEAMRKGKYPELERQDWEDIQKLQEAAGA